MADLGSPPSPNYYEEDDLDVTDPTPKNIDYQNTKRQKVNVFPFAILYLIHDTVMVILCSRAHFAIAAPSGPDAL